MQGLNMARNYMQPGHVMDYHNVGSQAILSGAVVAFADCVGVALVDIPAGDLGSVQLNGVFLLPKAVGIALSQGDLCYWGDSGVTANEGSVVAGRIWNAAVANEDVVAVKLVG